MKERIKAVRKYLKLTQAEFGARIKVKGNTVTGYETGIRSPSDAVINSICREFGVNEQWLRTGEGEMLVSPDKFSLDDFAKKRGATELELEIAKIYFELDPDIRKKAVEHFKERLATLPPKMETASEIAPAIPKSEAAIWRQLADLKRQNQELKERLEAIEQEEEAADKAEQPSLFSIPASSARVTPDKKNPGGEI